MKKLNAAQLRTSEADPDLIKKLKKKPIYIILEDVLDTYNVGAIFRLADALGVTEIFLCGTTETPPNPKIKKASVSTWKWVKWQYASTAVEAIAKLKTQNAKIKIVAVEQNKNSISLYDFKPEFPVALVVGNESYGISKEVLDSADTIVEIPMWGINKSLNVMVSCALVLYQTVNPSTH